jgi:hypothetical protein
MTKCAGGLRLRTIDVCSIGKSRVPQAVGGAAAPFEEPQVCRRLLQLTDSIVFNCVDNSPMPLKKCDSPRRTTVSRRLESRKLSSPMRKLMPFLLTTRLRFWSTWRELPSLAIIPNVALQFAMMPCGYRKAQELGLIRSHWALRQGALT